MDRLVDEINWIWPEGIGSFTQTFSRSFALSAPLSDFVEQLLYEARWSFSFLSLISTKEMFSSVLLLSFYFLTQIINEMHFSSMGMCLCR